jgi:polysaccharide deacetylase 2 family uncharacterized protein YibQ
MQRAGRKSWAWRALAGFWVFVLILCGAGAGTLQMLGPPAQAMLHAANEHHAALADAHATPPDAHATAPGADAAPALTQVKAEPALVPRGIVAAAPRPPNTAIPPPDDDLLAARDPDGASRLPRIASNGRMAMQAYAAGWDPSDARKKIAVLVADIGLSAQTSGDAADRLPAAMSFAISPYAVQNQTLLDRIRAAGHEMLVSLPMEPAGFGVSDPGPRALLTSGSADSNAIHLTWALTRFPGYVGVTGALGPLRGERFAASAQMGDILASIARAGLLYIDPRIGITKADPAAETTLVQRNVDLVLDSNAADSREIDRRLAQLEAIARRDGAALGLAGGATPIMIERLVTWAARLTTSDLVLVPVSAITLPRRSDGSRPSSPDRRTYLACPVTVGLA